MKTIIPIFLTGSILAIILMIGQTGNSGIEELNKDYELYESLYEEAESNKNLNVSGLKDLHPIYDGLMPITDKL